MKVFTDLHHFDLYYSFQLLFEDRLDWELYRPYGFDWLEEGYWHINRTPIIEQGYLGDGVQFELAKWTSFENQETWARHALELLRVGDVKRLNTPGLYRILDKSKDRYQNAISLATFKTTKFDIIISSLPHHFAPFEKLRQQYQPYAKHIFQAGNRWDVPMDCKNMMCSTVPRNIPSTINLVRYHQEFDLDTFYYVKSPNTKINSYIHFPESEDLWTRVKSFLPIDHSLKFIGKTLGPVKDIIVESSTLADCIINSGFTWHVKPGGDGYGHILYNSFACGTPVITSILDYKDMCGEELLVDGQTCINIDSKMPQQIAQEIYALTSNPNRFIEMQEQVRQQFESCVNFDKEFKDIELFLGRLQ